MGGSGRFVCPKRYASTPVYRLQELPNAYRPASHSSSSKGSFTCMSFRVGLDAKLENINHETAEVFMDYLLDALFIAALAFLLYKLLQPCFRGRDGISPPQPPRPGPSSNHGWFPWRHDDSHRPPPPPYSKFPPSTNNATGSSGTSQRGDQDRLGFWSGAALGGLGTYLLTRQREPEPRPRPYDWENDRYFARPDPAPVPRASGSSSRQQPLGRVWESREGPSNLGPTRRSTGYGGSSVR